MNTESTTQQYDLLQQNRFGQRRREHRAKDEENSDITVSILKKHTETTIPITHVTQRRRETTRTRKKSKQQAELIMKPHNKHVNDNTKQNNNKIEKRSRAEENRLRRTSRTT